MPAHLQLREWYLRHFLPLYHADARPRTIESYLSTISTWEKHTTNPPLAEITQLLIAQWRSELSGTAGNIAKHCRQLNAILTKLGPPGPRNRDALNILNVVPWAKPPRTMQKTHHIPHDDELDRFIHHAPPDLKLFAVTAACTGARQTAIRNLSATRIDARGQLIRYDPETDKTRTERVKPIPALLVDWWRLYGHHHLRWQVQRNSFSTRWRRHATSAGTPLLRPHAIKRWWGARLLRAGASPWCIKFALDHAQRDVTGIYYLEPFDELASLVNKIEFPTNFMEELCSTPAQQLANAFRLTGASTAKKPNAADSTDV